MKRLIIALIFILAGDAWAATYYVSTSGDDTANGTTTGTPWKTPYKVNSTTLAGDDNVLFKCGDIWIDENAGPITPSASGTSGHPVTWGSYGSGEKPIITNATRRNDTDDWTDEGGNIWSCGGIATTGSELLANPSFATDDTGWYCTLDSPSSGTAGRTTTAGEYDSAPAGFKISCTDNGTSAIGIHLRTTTGYHPALVAGKYYLFTFKAKASTGFTIPYIYFKTSAEDTEYGDGLVGQSPTITTDFATYSVILHPLKTLTNPALRFYLGGTSGIPDGATFYLDTMSLKEIADPAFFGKDYAANIIFNYSTGNTSAGTLKLNETLTAQGEWYHNKTDKKVYLYSVGNPATYYDDIIIVRGGLRGGWFNKGEDNNGEDYQVIDGIDFFACDMGVYAQNFTSLTVKNCKMTWMGGRSNYTKTDYAWGGAYNVRYGYGIACDSSINGLYIFNNEIDQIYDSPITWQGTTTSKTQTNIYVYKNVLGRSELGLEFWLRDNTCTMSNVYVHNNTIWGAGYGWGHDQRPDGVNDCLLFLANSTATMSNINIESNIFYLGKTTHWFDIAYWDQWSTALTLDYNTYYGTPSSNTMFSVSYNLEGSPFTSFSAWQTATGKDAHSINQDPLLTSDYRIPENSPCASGGYSTEFYFIGRYPFTIPTLR